MIPQSMDNVPHLVSVLRLCLDWPGITDVGWIPWIQCHAHSPYQSHITGMGYHWGQGCLDPSNAKTLVEILKAVLMDLDSNF